MVKYLYSDILSFISTSCRTITAFVPISLLVRASTSNSRQVWIKQDDMRQSLSWGEDPKQWQVWGWMPKQEQKPNARYFKITNSGLSDQWHCSASMMFLKVTLTLAVSSDADDERRTCDHGTWTWMLCMQTHFGNNCDSHWPAGGQANGK